MEFFSKLDIDQYSVVQLKKMFNESGAHANLFHEFTMQDVEDCKKRLFFKLSQTKNIKNPKEIQSFLDAAAMKIIQDKFGNHEISTGNILGIRETNKDNNGLNKNYINETERIISIDSTYRDYISPFNNSSTLPTRLNLNLSDKLENVVSLQLSNISIPFTFYNIDSMAGNNYFYVENTTSEVITKIEVSSGNYNASELITEINTQLTANSITDIEFSLNTKTNKVTIANTSGTVVYNIIFFDYLDEENQKDFSQSQTGDSSKRVTNFSKVNYNLGWHLGFRTINSNNMELTYQLAVSSSIVSEALCFVGYTKYFIITLNDMNQNQTNKGLVQIDNEKMFINKPRYFNEMDNSLNCITDANFNTYVSSSGRTLTKNQLYSALSVNSYRQNYSQKNSKIDANSLNNVLAIIPFESKSMSWGESVFTSDKNKFVRKYYGPIDISKMEISVYDDKGNLLNLNGQDWSMTLVSKHLYQY